MSMAACIAKKLYGVSGNRDLPVAVRITHRVALDGEPGVNAFQQRAPERQRQEEGINGGFGGW